MALPVVAIVGRPNVGKSSLFNMIAGRRISIVDPTAGVTRDRIGTLLEHNGRHFELVDTGGIGIVDADALEEDVERQIAHAIEKASIILFVVDIRDGVMPLDQTVAARLRTANKPILFLANKADETKIDVQASDLYRLGYGEPILTSANSKRGREEIMFALMDYLVADPEDAPTDVSLKLAIVGKRNVGKSTFINALAHEDRVIVSEVPGTTRDSVDVRFESDGLTYMAIDTAGVRKTTKLANSVEFYSLHRAQRSIRRADVVLHFFDARTAIGRVDKQLAEYIIEEHKPAIFVVNKWDLAKDHIETGTLGDYYRKKFPMLDYVPIAFITAKEGKNTLRVLQLAAQLHKQSGRRIPTGELNRLLAKAMQENTPPVRNNQQGRIYYAAQVGSYPPTIACVTNDPLAFDGMYLRYLQKCLRDEGSFGEVPIKIILRSRGEGGGRGKRDDDDVEVEIDDIAAPVPVPMPKKKEKPVRTKKASKTWDL
ncbi:ribosome biogenesis GTPase Der [soil metagenome]